MYFVTASSGEQPGCRIAAGNRARDRSQYLAHPLRIWTRRFRGRLRATQFGRGNHLHGLGNFLRRLGGGDANTHILEARHSSVALIEPSVSFFVMPGLAPVMAEIRRMSWHIRRPGISV